MKHLLMLAFVAGMLTFLGTQGKRPLDGPGLSVALAVAEHRDSGITISGFWLEGQVLQAWQLPSECASQEPSTCRSATPLDYEATYAGPGAGWLLSIRNPAPSISLDHINTVSVWSGGQDSTLLTSLPVNRANAGRRRSGSSSTSTLALVLAEVSVLESGREARKLLQEACSLTVDGTTHTFDGCSPASPRNSDFQLFYSLSPGANEKGALLRGGLRVAGVGPEGWAGWGLGTQGMVDANAVIVKTDSASSTGASVDGYTLPSYSATAINAAAGSFPLTDTSAALDSSGDLVAVFTAPLPGSPSDLTSSPFDYIWAMGPLSSAGALRQHSTFGMESLELKAASAAPKPSPEPAAAAPTAAPSPEPAAPEPAAAPPTKVDPPSAAAPSQGGGDTNATINDVQQACTLQLGNGTSSTFAACASLPGLAVPYTLYWTVLLPTGTAGNSSTSQVLMAFSGSTDREEGYLAMGFPSEPGVMEGATAFILQTCASCASGASIQSYYLGGYSESLVQPPGRLPASNYSATRYTASGATVLTGSFVVELDSALVSSPATNIIFAVGPLSSSGTPLQHDMDGSADIALQNGSIDNVKTESNGSLKAAHAWLMAIGWGVLIPSGIVMARCFKELDPLWFKVHRAVQTLGFLLGVAGFGVGFAIRSSWDTPYPVHRNMGVAVLSLAVVQMTALFARPDKTSGVRRFWNWGHWWLGRAAAALAIANIYYGIINVQKLGTWAWATYTAILTLIVAVAVVKDGMDFGQGRRTLFGREAAATASSEQELSKSAKSGLEQVATDGSSKPASQV